MPANPGVLAAVPRPFANESGLSITVCHFPPGTSKWNKIEHRMFRQISSNWRGQPLVSQEVIVELIGTTTTNDHGLEIRAEINRRQYATSIKVSDAELEQVNLHRARFHGDWNYTTHSQTNASRRAA